MPNWSDITCDYATKAETDVLLPMGKITSSAMKDSRSVLLLSKDTVLTKLALYYLNKNCMLDG